MRGVMALVLAGWFAVVTPCLAVAQCAAPGGRRSCCCKPGATCCCRPGKRGTPSPAPALPAPRVAPEHTAELPVGVNPPAAATLALGTALGVTVPAPIAPPAYLSACSFRC